MHVTRQTVSKFERNLSLPDLEVCKQICEYFEIDIKDFLEIEDKGNIASLYQQMSIMFDEMNKNNKRMKILYVLLIIICVISLVMTSFIYIRNQQLNKLVDMYVQETNDSNYNNNRTIVDVLKNDSDLYDTTNDYSYMRVNEYNLSKKTMEIEYQFTLKKYTKDTSMKLQFNDGTKTIMTLDLIKKRDNVFYIKKVIPLDNYFNIYMLVNDGNGNILKEDIGYQNCDYYRYILENTINITVPLKDNTLDLNHIVYKPSNNYGENVVGSLNATLYIDIYDKTKTKQILSTTTTLDKEKTISLNTPLPYNEDFYFGLIVEEKDSDGSSSRSLYMFNTGDIGRAKDMTDKTKIKSNIKEFNLYPYNDTVKNN